MIEIQHLTKRFGPLTAVRDLTLTVRPGEVLGFLGPNGAGKSTTMKMVTGYLAPDEGSVRICGHDIVQDTIAAQKKLGYLPEGAPAYGEMTPRQFLHFIAQVRELSGDAEKAATARAVAGAELQGVMDQPIETLLVPLQASWLKTAEAISFLRAVGPKRAFGIHDAQINSRGLHGANNWLTDQGRNGYRYLAPGEGFDL